MIIIDWPNYIKSMQTFCYILGFFSSTSMAYFMMIRTLKIKGYANLLWLALPVIALTGVDLLFRIPVIGVCVFIVSLITVFSIIGFLVYKQIQQFIKYFLVKNGEDLIKYRKVQI